jgi:cysteine desulfuration protein SufE
MGMDRDDAGTMTTIDEIIDNFALLDEWDDRYRYVIELGRALAPLDERNRSQANKVQGCASQVWLATTVRPNGADGPVLSFVGDSDAHIVRGLIAILFAIYSGKHAGDILSTDAIALFERMGLREHLTPQRSNGFRSMVERIKMDARAAMAAVA